jgi:hypothetical protein
VEASAGPGAAGESGDQEQGGGGELGEEGLQGGRCWGLPSGWRDELLVSIRRHEQLRSVRRLDAA